MNTDEVADMEAAMDTALSKEDRCRALQRLLVTRETLMQAKLEARLTEVGSTFESSVRGVVANLSKSPSNWHQATVYFAALGRKNRQDDELLVNPLLLLLGSSVLVLTQCTTAVTVLVGAFWPSCDTSDQCDAGKWCEVDTCNYCGSRVPMVSQVDPITGGLLNVPRRDEHVGFNASLVAEVCATPTERWSDGENGDGGTVSYYSEQSVQQWCGQQKSCG